MALHYTYTPSPLGDLLLAGQGETLSFIGFPQGKARMRHQDVWLPDDQAFRAWVDKEIAAYYRSGQTQKWYEAALADFGLDPKLAPPVMKELMN